MASNKIGSTRAASKDRENTSPLIKAGRKQAKRLLRLAREGHLSVGALHDAQGVVARIHGYPDWRSFINSAGGLTESVRLSDEAKKPSPDLELNEGVNTTRALSTRRIELVAIDQATHQKSLPDVIEKLSETNITNVLTVHFEPLRKKLTRNTKIAFVSIDDALATNLLLSPLGSQKMLATHKFGVSRVFTEIIGEYEDAVMRGLMDKAIDYAFEKTALQNHPVMWSLKERPGWISDRAFSVLKKSGSKSISYYQAERELIDVGLMDDAWQCHIRAMPTIVDVIDALGQQDVERIYGNSRNLNNTSLLRIAADRLTDACSKHVGTSVFNLPLNGTGIFHIDPLSIRKGINAGARWMYANMLASLRAVNKFAHSGIRDLPINAYDKPHEALWAESIFHEQQDRVMEYLRQQNSTEGVDIFDEMDGPIRSDTVENALISKAMENRKWARGTWICVNQPDLVLKGSLMAILGEPKKISDGMEDVF